MATVARDVLVLRHGRTGFNASGRLQGQLDVPLDAVGRRQAEDVALSLAGEGITRVLSSDLRRARSTAEAVGRALGLPVLLDARLREQHYGAWQGLTRDEVRDRWPAAHADWERGDGDPVDGEQLSAVADRAVAAVEELRPGTGALLVVTHGDVARALRARLEGTPLRDVPPLANTGWTVIRESIHA